jgi:hypothetical protein
MRALRDIGAVQVGLSKKHCAYSKTRFKTVMPLARLRFRRCSFATPWYLYMLDLQPDRSLIRELDVGVDVYLLDGLSGRRDRFVPLSEHVCGYLDDALNSSSNKAPHDAINLLGVCKGLGQAGCLR